MKRAAACSVLAFSLSAVFPAAESHAGDRDAVVAGSWYPGTKKALSATVKKYLGEAGPIDVKGRPAAVIAPHAGYQYSGRAAGWAFRPLEGWKIKRVILMGPSHRYPLRGVSVDAFDNYVTPLGKVPVDKEACKELLKNPCFKWEPRAGLDEHSLEIELPFLQTVLEEFTLIPLVVGDVNEPEAARIAGELKRFVDDETVIVASSDFTHYGMSFGYAPFGKDARKNIEKLDKGAIDLILKKDLTGYLSYLGKTGATICGRNPIAILIETLPKNANGHLLKYYTSGDLTDDYSHSVSYAAILFTVTEKTTAEKKTPGLKKHTE